MKQFEDAARKSAEGIESSITASDQGWITQGSMQSIIESNFAELAATHEKLVELISVYRELEEIEDSFSFRTQPMTLDQSENYDRLKVRMSEIESDPLVIKAIKEAK